MNPAVGSRKACIWFSLSAPSYFFCTEKEQGQLIIIEFGMCWLGIVCWKDREIALLWQIMSKTSWIFSREQHQKRSCVISINICPGEVWGWGLSGDGSDPYWKRFTIQSTEDNACAPHDGELQWEFPSVVSQKEAALQKLLQEVSARGTKYCVFCREGDVPEWTFPIYSRLVTFWQWKLRDIELAYHWLATQTK